MTPDPSGPSGPEAGGAADARELLGLAVRTIGGAPRDGQLEMAARVADALDRRRHLLVQAGTGTGKSLGYLVPAVAHAVRAGEPVLVSTATLALQRQVMTRDLPAVSSALEEVLPRAPRVALLKGWHNYACVHKVAGGYPEDEPAALFALPGGEPAGSGEHPAGPARRSGAESLAEQVLRVRAWLEETDTGDRDDLVPGVSDRAWRQVAVTKAECLGPSCPMREECLPERARQQALAADVVVTNHAMLGVAAAGTAAVLPPHGALIVDEAHELADRITRQASVEMSAAVVEQAQRVARRQAGVASAELESAASALRTAVQGLDECVLTHGLPEEVGQAVAATRDAARALLADLRPEPGSGQAAASARAGLQVARAGVQALFDTAERFLSAEPSREVVWVARGEGETRGGAWDGEGATSLRLAPLGVAVLIRHALLDDRASVFTSATLTLGGSFEPVARAVGLAGGGPAAPAAATGAPAAPDGAAADPDASSSAPTSPPSSPGRPSTEGVPPPDRTTAGALPWDGVDVGTPFDYARQGLLYVAAHLPPPGRQGAAPEQADEFQALIEAADGRCLGLFSSRRAAEEMAREMRARVSHPILCQGEDQLPALVERFAADPRTCLFGTLSLWQGVDVPGVACQLVVIDRIPFPRPDDPLMAARSRRVELAGGNGFLQVSATHAAVLLAQGAGRLIRSGDDRGVVAVLDPRLARARYGGFLVRSLPGFSRTTDREQVLGALRRLTALG